MWGDGIVPVPCAHLEGAHQLTLDGVYHSPVGAHDTPEPSTGKSGTASGGPRLWYGSTSVLEQWVDLLSCEEAEIRDGEVEVGGLVEQMVEAS